MTYCARFKIPLEDYLDQVGDDIGEIQNLFNKKELPLSLLGDERKLYGIVAEATFKRLCRAIDHAFWQEHLYTHGKKNPNKMTLSPSLNGGLNGELDEEHLLNPRDYSKFYCILEVPQANVAFAMKFKLVQDNLQDME